MSREHRGDDESGTERIEVSVALIALPMDEWMLIAACDEMEISATVPGDPVDPADYVGEFTFVGKGRTEAEIRHRDGTVVSRAVRMTAGFGGGIGGERGRGPGRGGDPSGDREPRQPTNPIGAGAVRLEEPGGAE